MGGSPVENRRVLLRGLAPQHGGQRGGAVGGGVFQRGTGKRLPPAARMGVCRALLHGQHRVQQQHTLSRPQRQVGVCGTAWAKLGLQLLKNVAQARRSLAAVRHREGQPHGLTRLMVGVLPQNDDPHRRHRAGTERGEDVLRRGVDVFFRRSRRHKGIQLRKVRLCALLRKKQLPVGAG